MATAHELPDTADLTADRFRSMSGASIGARDLPPPSGAGLPPGPGWPVLVQSAALMRFRHRFHPYLQRTYGDVFTVRLIPGGRPLVFFTRPEHAREIFAGDPEVFHAGKGNAILGPIMGRHSLLLQDSMEHKRARKLLMPAFNGQALKGYRGLVSELAADEAEHWPDGATFRSLDRMNALTLEVILRVVFGVTDADRLAAMRPLVNATVDISPVVLLGWGYPWLQRMGPWKRTVDTQAALDRLIHAEIRERRTLAWALRELGQHPDLLRRSQEAALGTGPDGPTTEDDAWLEAVMKESMRLHPVIPMVVRTLMEPATIGGVDLPAGTTVGPSIIVAHQRPENHSDPDAFRPERFLGQNPPTNTWIPFGGGVRRCIGAGFAQMEGVAVLREVLTRWDIAAVGPEEPKVRNITSVPKRGALVRVTRR